MATKTEITAVSTTAVELRHYPDLTVEPAQKHRVRAAQMLDNILTAKAAENAQCKSYNSALANRDALAAKVGAIRTEQQAARDEAAKALATNDYDTAIAAEQKAADLTRKLDAAQRLVVDVSASYQSALSAMVPEVLAAQSCISTANHERIREVEAEIDKALAPLVAELSELYRVLQMLSHSDAGTVAKGYLRSKA